MTNRAVNVGGGMNATASVPLSNRAPGALDVSHLRPLSEGVLRATGLHGGLDASGKVRDLRGANTGAVDPDIDQYVSDEPHAKWARLQEETQGLIERNVNADGTVTLRIVYGDGDVMTAKAADTEKALALLIDKFGGAK